MAFPPKVAGCAAIVVSSIGIFGGCTSKTLTLGNPVWHPRVVEGPTLVDLAPYADKQVSNATLTADLLEVFFSTDNDIWWSSRATPDAPFATPVRLDAVNSHDFRESSPAISLDGLTLWFSSARPGGIGQMDIWVSKRATRTAGWSPPTNCTTLNSEGDDLPRPPGNHGLVMPLSSVRDTEAGKLYDIYFATRPNTDADFDAPVRAPELPHPPVNSSTDPFLTDDGLGLFYSGSPAWKPFDIVFTQHNAWGETFSNFNPLDAINTADWRENDPWLSPDGSTLYFTSNRAGIVDGGVVSEAGAIDDADAHQDRIYRVVLDPPWTP